MDEFRHSYKEMNNMAKRASEKEAIAEAFKYRKLNRVELNDICAFTHVYQINKELSDSTGFNVTTSDNTAFWYGRNVIQRTSTSATFFEKVEKLTKTGLIKLFASLSIHDIWSAEFETNAKCDSWMEDLIAKIVEMKKCDAKKYIKNNYTSFGKTKRYLIGQKILPSSDNNYYTVRDLKIHFDLMTEGCNAEVAQKDSIRKLDVNSLQYLIFNGVKYELKTNKE